MCLAGVQGPHSAAKGDVQVFEVTDDVEGFS